MGFVNRATWMVGLMGLSCLTACVGEESSDPTTSDQEALLAPVPPRGLQSNSNFAMADVAADGTCTALKGIHVAVDFTTALIANQEFTIQLNAYSPPLAGDTTKQFVVQQYAFAVSNVIQVALNDWTTADLATNTPVAILETLPVTSPITDGIPAGYELTFVVNADTTGKVTSVEYKVNNGVNTSETTAILTSKVIGGTQNELAPIVAFEVEIVGPPGGNHAHFTQGGGSINYVASTAFSPLASVPSCAAVASKHTLETSNSVYGLLPAGPSKTFSQVFTVLAGSP